MAAVSAIRNIIKLTLSPGQLGERVTAASLIPGYTPIIISSTASGSGVSLSAAKSYCDEQFPTGGVIDLANNLCKVGAFLVVPSDTTVNRFKELRPQDRFPLDWGYALGSILGSAMLNRYEAESLGRYASFSFTNLDFDTTTSHSVSFTLYNTASVSEYLPVSGIEFIRTASGYLMWFGFAFSVFKFATSTL